MPGIGEFLDARIVSSFQLESSETMVSNSINKELQQELCGIIVGWGEFSIWEE